MRISMYAVTSKREIEDVKSHLRTTWMAGDYDRFSRYMENEARAFYERLRVPPGSKLLDVACGSGQLALFAARELVRVCVPGGTIAMANWTAGGFIGEMFKVIGRFIAPSTIPFTAAVGRCDHRRGTVR